MDDEATAAALSRNDRYLREFIEALAICPFARGCRESGRLHREVQLTEIADVETITARIRTLETELSPDIEVALLLFPNLTLSAYKFERLISDIQRAYQAGRSGPLPFFVVAFHPELTRKLDNPDVAVRFMRRSPDPTIQLVRPGAIDRVRGERDATILSRSIAEAGLAAVLAHDPDHVTAQLAAMRARKAPSGSDSTDR